jgi:hypothetical protein
MGSGGSPRGATLLKMFKENKRKGKRWRSTGSGYVPPRRESKRRKIDDSKSATIYTLKGHERRGVLSLIDLTS